MITRWITALVNFAAGFATASVLFLLAPSKGDTHDSDEDIETLDRLEDTQKEVEKEIDAIETEIDNMGRLAAEKEQSK